ncbi:hypothetical protein QBC33DRAFT_547060 [Phialemonium atrogriseum]|uniref:Uncharacterized protein n=1 Tax=Phialemonium atrogriseum TaxID=1093897 RepID=A0AAJ0FEI3_9PEZI|nr:uncharacterized protein QBC33DRAFT_547060 [Phialemonium atrogriseum]KAK1764382.1 hypothetical protein QBC33DRAFT_547060 [Phialemonium atrogriseum]
MSYAAAAKRLQAASRGRPSAIRLRLQAEPFLDDTVMDGPPSRALSDLKTPRLRKCPFDLNSVSWKHAKILDGGLDGCVWRVNFGDQGPFALKVFWDAEPPSRHDCYSAQRECQNNALLQIIEAAVEQANAESNPILVNPNPRSKDEAMANLLAFSGESCPVEQVAQGSNLTQIQSIPRITKCYGWLRFSGQVFLDMPRRTRPPSIVVSKEPRSFSLDKEYLAIVYEYIEDGENDPTVVEQVGDFFYLAGFSFAESPLEKNWKQGVLIDFSDIVHPGGFGWAKQLYGPRKAEAILRS